MREVESVFVDIGLLHKEQRRCRRLRFLLCLALLIIYFQWLANGELRKELVDLKPKERFTTINEELKE